MEERQLIEGCLRGESWARKKVYELHAPAMMSICRRYVNNHDTARDLLHDGFVRLFTKINTYSGAGSFNGWMKRIFVTMALEYLRRGNLLQYGTDVEAFDYSDEEPDMSRFDHLSSDDLFACVASLPDKCRIVFNMYAMEEYTHAEIAKALKISESTSRSQYASARQLLQKMLMNRIASDGVARQPKAERKTNLKLKCV
jgi:RNA polymerase sigma-70 factor (ECF subfamily)